MPNYNYIEIKFVLDGYDDYKRLLHPLYVDISTVRDIPVGVPHSLNLYSLDEYDVVNKSYLIGVENRESRKHVYFKIDAHLIDELLLTNFFNITTMILINE